MNSAEEGTLRALLANDRSEEIVLPKIRKRLFHVHNFLDVGFAKFLVVTGVR